MDIEINRLLIQIEEQYWKEAKTFKDTAPHEYFMLDQNPSLFVIFKYLINTYGFEREFHLYKYKAKYRYFYLGEYSYWIIEDCLNRCRLDGSFIRL